MKATGTKRYGSPPRQSSGVYAGAKKPAVRSIMAFYNFLSCKNGTSVSKTFFRHAVSWAALERTAHALFRDRI